jgi:hypothetical protein
VPITLKFKTGNDRTFPEAVEARLEQDTLVLKRADGLVVAKFRAEHVVAVNAVPLHQKSN